MFSSPETPLDFGAALRGTGLLFGAFLLASCAAGAATITETDRDFDAVTHHEDDDGYGDDHGDEDDHGDDDHGDEGDHSDDDDSHEDDDH